MGSNAGEILQFDIWTLLLAIGAFQGFLLFLFLNKKSNRNQSSTYLSLLVFIIVINLIDYLIIASKAYRIYPHLITFSNPTIFLIAPLYFQFVKSHINKVLSLKWADLLHLTPFIIASFYHMNVFFLSADQKIRFVEQYLLIDHHIISSFAIVYITIHTLQNITYALFANRLVVRNSIKWLQKVNYAYILYWVILYIILMSFAALDRLTFETDYLIVLINALLLTILVFSAIGENKVIKTLLNGSQLKYQHSNLSAETINTYLIKFNKIMLNQKPFLEPNLKLNQLAEQIGISSNHLSQLLNENIKMSFNDYLNSKRIQRVKELLGTDGSKHLNLYGIALTCGFNSKNTFNRAFKKETGLTPSEYRKKNVLLN